MQINALLPDEEKWKSMLPRVDDHPWRAMYRIYSAQIFFHYEKRTFKPITNEYLWRSNDTWEHMIWKVHRLWLRFLYFDYMSPKYSKLSRSCDKIESFQVQVGVLGVNKSDSNFCWWCFFFQSFLGFVVDAFTFDLNVL